MSMIIKVKNRMETLGLKNFYYTKMYVVDDLNIFNNFDSLVISDDLNLHSNLGVLVSNFCSHRGLVSYYSNTSLYKLSE